MCLDASVPRINVIPHSIIQCVAQSPTERTTNSISKSFLLPLIRIQIFLYFNPGRRQSFKCLAHAVLQFVLHCRDTLKLQSDFDVLRETERESGRIEIVEEIEEEKRGMNMSGDIDYK